MVAVLDDLKVLTERVRYDAPPAKGGRARHRWPMDLDGDGDSDGTDHSVQFAAASTTIHGTNYNPDADHDRDGDVDTTDYFTFLGGTGKAALTDGLISNTLGPDNPIGYDGYVFAPEAGIVVGTGGGQTQAVGAYCVRFRWYLPETGRWMQRDPLGYVDSLNRFEDVASNPTGNVDPFGLARQPRPTVSRIGTGRYRIWYRNSEGRIVRSERSYENLPMPGSSLTVNEYLAFQDGCPTQATCEEMEDVAAAYADWIAQAEKVGRTLHAAADTCVVAAGLFIPGPEDAIIMAFLAARKWKLAASGAEAIAEHSDEVMRCAEGGAELRRLLQREIDLIRAQHVLDRAEEGARNHYPGKTLEQVANLMQEVRRNCRNPRPTLDGGRLWEWDGHMLVESPGGLNFGTMFRETNARERRKFIERCCGSE